MLDDSIEEERFNEHVIDNEDMLWCLHHNHSQIISLHFCQLEIVDNAVTRGVNIFFLSENIQFLRDEIPNGYLPTVVV